ncbi:hypothetical protein ACROYT_G038086 [Oculina patagonica]
MADKVIPAAELTFSVLEKLLEAMGSIKRKIAIGIANETSCTWEALNVHFLSGASDVILPEFVKTTEAALKTKGPTATGSVGVLAYYMKDVNKTLAVLFSVPFDYNLYSNLWDAKVYPGRKKADYDMYKELYYGNPFKGDNGWHSKVIGGGFSVKGIMTSAGSCIQKLRISQ